MNANYRLTVVTAVRNLIEAGRADMMRRCVDSVAKQKIDGGVEHIIVDGASTDGTLSLVNDIISGIQRSADSCIRVISKPDHQVYEGMNNGLAEAHGEYIIFLNSDDYFIGTRRLNKALALFDHEKADVGYADTYVSRPGTRHLRRQHSDINKLPFADHFVHQSMVTKTEVMREFGGFDISRRSFCTENEFSMRLVKDEKKFVRSSQCFCIYSLDGMSAHSNELIDHDKVFFRHFGLEMGLTEEECSGLYYFRGIGSWSEEKCRVVLKKLESHPEWAAIWRREVDAIFKNGKRTKGSLWRRLSRNWDENGIEGIYESIKRRLV